MDGFPRTGRKRKSGCVLRMAAVVLFGLWSSVATADPAGTSGNPATSNEPMTFQADEVTYDQQLALTVAKGHVEIAQGTQILLADVVTYNQHTDTVTASGQVSLMMREGTGVCSGY